MEFMSSCTGYHIFIVYKYCNYFIIYKH